MSVPRVSNCRLAHADVTVSRLFMVECRSTDPDHRTYPRHFHLWGELSSDRGATFMAKWFPEGWEVDS